MLKTKRKTKTTLKTQITKSKSIINTKPKNKPKPKPTSRSKLKTKTMSSSMTVSKKNLHLQTLNYQTGRKLAKSDSKGLIGKMHLLRWCTQTDKRIKQMEIQDMETKQNTCNGQVQEAKAQLLKNKSSSEKLESILFHFSKQIQLERQLRLIKHVFSSSNFTNLSNQLLQSSISQSDLQLQLDQYDPLFQPQNSTISPQDLLYQIMNCHNNWKQSIRHKFSKQQVIILFEKIDCNMNGLIDLKSFTRELGNLMGKAFRKKDTLRIFRRLEKNDEISLCSLIKELCKREYVE